MKRVIKATILVLAFLFTTIEVESQTVYNAQYVKALYARFPSRRSDFCKACKYWENPYYKSIADTERHMPLVTYEHFKKADYARIAAVKVPRTGVFASWNSVTGQPNEDKVYSAGNKITRAYDPKDIIAKGHCEAWILNAFSYDSAILSNTYTFNAACESQGQNTGTELASENVTRRLLADYDVDVWCGTFGGQATFTDGKLTCTYPEAYWKIIKCNGKTTCYWMPNKKTEKQDLLPDRVVDYSSDDPQHPGLVQRLKFKPMEALHD